MERFFRSLKSEWVPTKGYNSFSEAQSAVIRYMTGYYSAIRPHWYNGGLTPNESERLYWLQSNAVASISLPLHFAQSLQTVRLIKTGEGRNCQPGLRARNIEFDSLIFAKTCSNLSVTTIKLMTQRFYCFLRICRVPQRTINLNPGLPASQHPVVILLGDLPHWLLPVT